MFSMIIFSWMFILNVSAQHAVLYKQDIAYSKSNLISSQQYYHAIPNAPVHLDYTYDALQRLKESKYISTNNIPKDFGTTYQYDLNGNILYLGRQGVHPLLGYTAIDSLYYSYDIGSNKLETVKDLSEHDQGYTDIITLPKKYTYNVNGSLIRDKNKTQLIHRNILDKVDTIHSLNNGYTVFTYTANGSKVAEAHYDNQHQLISQKIKVGSYSYDSQMNLRFLQEKNGRWINNNGTFAYQIDIRDHLTNAHLTVSDLNTNNQIDTSTEILQEQHYYPFGLEIKGLDEYPANNSLENQYKFNGGEPNGFIKQRMEQIHLAADTSSHYLSQSYYRFLDNSYGRFLSIDPKASSFESPYVMMANNPISNTDLLGDTAEKSTKQEALDYVKSISTSLTQSDYFTTLPPDQFIKELSSIISDPKSIGQGDSYFCGQTVCIKHVFTNNPKGIAEAMVGMYQTGIFKQQFDKDGEEVTINVKDDKRYNKMFTFSNTEAQIEKFPNATVVMLDILLSVKFANALQFGKKNQFNPKEITSTSFGNTTTKNVASMFDFFGYSDNRATYGNNVLTIKSSSEADYIKKTIMTFIANDDYSLYLSGATRSMWVHGPRGFKGAINSRGKYSNLINYHNILVYDILPLSAKLTPEEIEENNYDPSRDFILMMWDDTHAQYLNKNGSYEGFKGDYYVSNLENLVKYTGAIHLIKK